MSATFSAKSLSNYDTSHPISPSEARSSGSNSSSMRAGSRAESLFDVYRDNKDVREQWETTVENMASSKPCNDPTCSDCRWPRSQHPRIECLTARAKCPRIAAKFEEHVQVVYYDHALQHLTTITVVAYCLLAAVLMMYSVGSNGAEFVTTPERDFSTYPTVALLTVLIGVGCDLVLLVFLWGVQAGCWLRLGQEQIAAATAREKRLRRSKSARGGGGGGRGSISGGGGNSSSSSSSAFGSGSSGGSRFAGLGRRARTSKWDRMLDKVVTCHQRSFDSTRKHMQLFQIAVLLPVIVSTSACIFFCYFGKFQAQREFLKHYFCLLYTSPSPRDRG